MSQESRNSQSHARDHRTSFKNWTEEKPRHHPTLVGQCVACFSLFSLASSASLGHPKGDRSGCRSFASASRSPGHSASTDSPEPDRLGGVAALGGQHGQVAPGQVAVDAHVQAGELLRTPQAQDPPPALLRLGRLAPMAVDHRLAEQQLGVLGVEGEALGTGPQRRGRLAHHLVRPRDQGEQLPRDRVARRRAAPGCGGDIPGPRSSRAARWRSRRG